MIFTLSILFSAIAMSMISAAETSATLSKYTIQQPDHGSCRLKGIEKNSKNFENYASISFKYFDKYKGCGRCIKVSCKDQSKCAKGSSVTAFVLDICQGCDAGEVKLSISALESLSLDDNTNQVAVSYKFVNCPDEMLSGKVQACLMDGAGPSYVPLQFYNSQKAVAKATINGAEAQPSKDDFLFAANLKGQNSNDWYKKIDVMLKSSDDETVEGTFSFEGDSGCVTSNFQFSSASTADGEDGDGLSSTTKTVIIPVAIGVVAVIVILIASVIFVRRRRAALHDDDDRHHVENQYLSPKNGPTNGGSYQNEMDNTVISMENQTPESPVTGGYTSATSPTTMDDKLPAAVPVQQSFSRPSEQALGYSYNSENVTQSFSSHVSSTGSPSRTSKKTDFAEQSASPPVTQTVYVPVVQQQITTPSSVRPHQSEEDRTSFDIDDLRNTEIEKQRTVHQTTTPPSFYEEVVSHPYANYETAVTSPQSFVQASSLRRTSSKSREPSFKAPSVPQVRQISSQPVDLDAFASTASTNHPSSSNRDSETGYSRGSLNILGYPFAKKSAKPLEAEL
jgi:hypothetical protein